VRRAGERTELRATTIVAAVTIAGGDEEAGVKLVQLPATRFGENTLRRKMLVNSDNAN
jgi:hypothetical protein